MCTLALAWQVFPETPVVVGANRDESLERPSEPPAVYRTSPRVIAPSDARAGGTWIGVNESGLFVGITNFWTDADLAGERSRGLLVGDALSSRSADEALETVTATTSAFEYEGFVLVLADATDAYALVWDGTLERTAFDPGVHVVVNVGFDDRFSVPSARAEVARAQAENARRVRNALTGAADTVRESGGGSDAWLERAASVLGDHDYGVCVHGDGFGTRSSSLLAVGTETTYAFADGPPCRTPYEFVDVGPL
ncbi:NRDE family protein [Natronobiforma cellulositropha]|uniref:NRDE family protein n=1 Tax=Natronobiforma cellulositropha TaxID=1679076 RepID=UPI0021D57AAF|nr:NRDE family protein [Natronobiforma cellulositropha]